MIEFASSTAIADNLNVDHFIKTIEREDPSLDPDKQSGYPDFIGPNGREPSFGVCQIDLDYHLDITLQEAENPAFCIPWMANQWKSGHARLWAAWREFSASGWGVTQ